MANTSRKIRLMLPLLFIVSMAFIASYATTISVTTTNSNGLQGNYFVDNNVFTFAAASPEFQVAPSTGGATATPVTWSSGGSINVNAITSGDWMGAFTVTVATATAGTYTITIQVSQNGGAYTSYTTSVTITGSSSGSMTLDVDLGSSMTPNIAVVISA